MDRTAFENELREQGYGEVVDRRMKAGEVNRTHAHEFDARLLVLEGAMTIAAESGERTYRAGDIFEMPAGRPHSETAGPQGARYLAGRRYQSGS
ncbi:MAG: cupin domain-containing protein [Alphaproteobacteria bacterium]